MEPAARKPNPADSRAFPPVVPRSVAAWVACAAAAAVHAALAWRFRWLCDDAYISFRYARNLARGLGLVYNPGEDPRVEGYSNFLWVLFLAPFEAFGGQAPRAAMWTSAACGVATIVVLGRLLSTRTAGALPALGALAFAATLPPLACWATSGLETMPFTLALFGAFAALHGQRPRTAAACVAAVAAVLLRADGALFVGLVVATSLAVAWMRRERPLARAAWIAGAAAFAATVAHVLWRHHYYGAWEPNTARVKVELSAMVLERGVNYVATFALSFPAAAIALALSGAALRSPRDPLGAAALAVVAATVSYSIVLGGDFMAMGRFLVPCLPFLALALGIALARVPRPVALIAPALSVALSLAGAAGLEPVPRDVRTRFEFRYSSEDTPSEFEQWIKMRQQSRRWAATGRALARHGAPGESLMLGTIGAIGYHSGLVIHDPFGLVNREEFAQETADERRSPGHQRRVPFATFLAKRPTYLDALLVPRDAPMAALRDVFRPGGELYEVSRPEWLDASGIPGAPPDHVLRRIRYVPGGD